VDRGAAVEQVGGWIHVTQDFGLANFFVGIRVKNMDWAFGLGWWCLPPHTSSPVFSTPSPTSMIGRSPDAP